MIYVDSEIGKLEKVIVHKPDSGIERISPRRAEELLFDDIVYLPLMQSEHKNFVDVLQMILGNQSVLEIQDLLAESLSLDDNRRIEFLKRIILFEELPSSWISKLEHLDPDQLAQVLITGYLPKEDFLLFDPIPNFIFTRDIGVTIKDHIIITRAAKEGRYRENLLTQFAIQNHPLFSELVANKKIIDLNDLEKFSPSAGGEKASIEGGDVMMLNQNYLLIGCSERTTNHAISMLKEVVFEKELVENVVQINIPSHRSCMHIDTLFTRISENDIVCYKPIIVDGISSNVKVSRRSGETEIYDSVKSFFYSEINRDIRFIHTGGGKSPYQEREQWTDGCNIVALCPGVGITYDRNPWTEKEFIKAGYNLIHVDELLKNGIEQYGSDGIQNTIILMSSSELSRSRGGSHCLTFPIRRSKLS